MALHSTDTLHCCATRRQDEPRIGRRGRRIPPLFSELGGSLNAPPPSSGQQPAHCGEPRAQDEEREPLTPPSEGAPRRVPPIKDPRERRPLPQERPPRAQHDLLRAPRRRRLPAMAHNNESEAGANARRTAAAARGALIPTGSSVLPTCSLAERKEELSPLRPKQRWTGGAGSAANVRRWRTRKIGDAHRSQASRTYMYTRTCTHLHADMHTETSKCACRQSHLAECLLGPPACRSRRCHPCRRSRRPRTVAPDENAAMQGCACGHGRGEVVITNVETRRNRADGAPRRICSPATAAVLNP